MAKVPIKSDNPDFKTTLHLDAFAPRVARYHVAQVDRPGPDLRDAVVLLTSEIVTRAVERCQSDQMEVELRVWMPSDVVRVELRAPPELLSPRPEDRDAPRYDEVLLGQVADRWSIDADEHLACTWFEIDRHAPVAEAVESEQRPQRDTRLRAISLLRRLAPRRSGTLVRSAPQKHLGSM
jgi:hypothetical protein